MKEISEDIIQQIKERIVKLFHPNKIILFGSSAIGKTKKYSDIDLLIIQKSELPKHKRSIPIINALKDFEVPMDIIVYTPEEVGKWRDASTAFVTSVLKNGKVLYEK